MSEQHNVFDNGTPTVPVVVEVGGRKRVIGQAIITNTEEGVNANITLNTDDPAEAIEFLQGGLTSISNYSIDEKDLAHPFDDDLGAISEAEAQALFEFPAHDHKLVQHRDGKPSWCNTCRLDVDLHKPVSKITGHIPNEAFGFPKTH